MNENLILLVDYDKICRLCLHTTGAMSDLFACDGGTSLQDLVLRATGLAVEKNDAFPSKICHRCRYIVELNCELRDMVTKTNTLLMNASRQLEIVDEKCEKSPEIQAPQIKVQTEDNREERPDLRLIMQDDGIMTLIKPDPENPVDEKPENIDDRKIENVIEVQEKDKEIKIISRARRAPPKHLTCQICLSTFPSADHVGSHAPVHYVNSSLTPYTRMQRPYKCEVCRKFVSKTQLIRHHRTHLNVNPFVCKQAGCDYVGNSQDSLRRHSQSHGARSLVCEQCGASFRRGFSLSQHVARAHRPAPAHCKQCSKSFRNALTLATHMRIQHKPRRHVCQWMGCTKAYHTPASLAVHMRTHTDERLFRCHLCSAAAYTSQSLLNRHLRMHERSRLSKCDKCVATFEDYGDFYTHRVTEHGRWQPYQCGACPKRYRTESKLEEHLQICEQTVAVRSLDGALPTDAETEQLLVTSIQEIIDSESKNLQLEGDVHEEITVDLLDKFRGQSLLVQPGNISDFSKDLKLQDLPAGGLLYVEVDSETDDNAHDAWQQQFDGSKE